MNRTRKYILIGLAISVISLAGAVSYHSYVENHSYHLLYAKVTMGVQKSSSQQVVEINVSMMISSNDSLTRYNFVETGYSGVTVKYAGSNFTDAKQYLGGKTLPPARVMNLTYTINLNLANSHPSVHKEWNLTMMNSSTNGYQKAPEGYYYLSADFIPGKNNNSLYGTVPEEFVHISDSSASIVAA